VDGGFEVRGLRSLISDDFVFQDTWVNAEILVVASKETGLEVRRLDWK